MKRSVFHYHNWRNCDSLEFKAVFLIHDRSECGRRKGEERETERKGEGR